MRQILTGAQMSLSRLCLTFSDPPEVTLDTTAIVRQMGGTVMLQCMFDGNPTPTITWWFNGTMLNTSPSRFTTSVAGNVSTLTVTSLVGDDTGSYQCRGENGIGSVTTSDMVSLTVQGELWISVSVMH